MLNGALGPAIHHGQTNRQGRTVQGYRPQGTYCLWLLESGSAQLVSGGERRTLMPPLAALQQPVGDDAIDLPAGSEWQRLVFDMIRRPLRRIRGGTARMPTDPDQTQPLPPEVWGVALPILVPPELLASCRRMMTDCQTWWWRSDLGLVRSEYRLGLWLLEWVARVIGDDSLHPAFLPRRTGMDQELDVWLGQTLDRIEERLELGVCIEDLAQGVGMSPATFRRRFRQETGLSPQAYVAEERLRRACRLLADTDREIASIAGLVGYASVTTFSNRFRAWAGCTPGEWRRRNR